MNKQTGFPYWYLLGEMTRVEFKLRDQGTLFGFLWTLLQPTLMFVVLYMLFIKWLGHFVSQYGAYLLIGLVLWNFFQKATSMGLSSLKRRTSLIRNYRFPREIVVFSAVLSVFVSSLLEMLILLPFLFLLGVRPNLAWLWIPLIVVILLAFVISVALFLAVFAAEFHDMERIWEVVTTALFYLTPIFYPLTIVGGWKRRLLSLNPLTIIIMNARACLIDGLTPRPYASLAVIFLTAIAFAGGVAFLRRCEHRFADTLIA